MKKDLKVGFAAADIDAVRAILERLIGGAFEERDSSFYGGRYFRLNDPKFGELIIQENYDQTEKEWIEADHSDLPILLRVSGAPNHNELKSRLIALEGSRLIREQEF